MTYPLSGGTRRPALDELAEALFWKMEQMDPSGLDWADLSERERLIYSAGVEHLLRQERLDEAAASVRI